SSTTGRSSFAGSHSIPLRWPARRDGAGGRTRTTSRGSGARGSGSRRLRRPAALADVAVADRLDQSGVDERPLQRLRCGAAQPAVEVRPPVERATLGARVELVEQCRGLVEIGVLLSPLVEARRRRRIVAGGDEQPVLALVPLLRRAVDPLG